MKKSFSLLKAAVLLLSLLLSAAFIRQYIIQIQSSLGAFHETALFFFIGIFAFAAVRVFIPIPTRLYVFGHEFAHVLAILLSGGRVKSFKVNSEGGSVESDKNNSFIALAPYFLPVYTLLLFLAFNIAGLFRLTETSSPLFYFLIGFSYSFHMFCNFEFTRSYQPDLQSEGIIFSYSVILLANLIVISVMAELVLPGFSFAGFYGASIYSIYDFTVTGLDWLLN